jgi:mono/diheme cytochrome c family protein
MRPALPMRAIAGCAAALVAAGALAQAEPPAPASDPSAADAGKRLYTNYCARCHGLNMNTTSAAVFDLRAFPREDKSRFFESVTKGKRAMPAWGGTLQSAEIELLWAYVSAPR